jgi:hypothetical protein
MTIIKDFFKDTTRILQAEFQRSGTVKHGGEKGRNREYFIDNFLKKAFPQKFVIGTGEIIDSSEKVSKQADIVVYDEHLPVFDYGSSKHFLSGGVLAHIEVKSNLDGAELEDVVRKTQSVKNLSRDIDQTISFGPPPKTIFSCCFAYKGLTKENFKKKFIELHEAEDSSEKIIDAICVLGEYVMIKKSDTQEIVFYDTKEDSLLVFFSRLFYAMQKNWAGVPNIGKYVGKLSSKSF